MTRTRSTYLALLAILMLPMAANADLISISGAADSSIDGQWNIVLVEGAFDDLPDLLSQVWWGDNALARLFAEALGEVAGVQNFGIDIGPMFATSVVESSVYFSSWLADPSATDVYGLPEGAYGFCCAASSATYVYATASRVPEPGTLALFGIGLLGMGLAKRRKRA